MAQLRYSAMRSSGHTTTISPTSSTASNAAIDQVSMGRPEISTSCLPPSWPKRSPEPPAKIMAAVFGLFDTLPEKCTVLAPVSLKSRRAAASSATSTSAVGTNTGSITPNSAAPPTVLTFSGALMGSPFMASTTKGRPQTPPRMAPPRRPRLWFVNQPRRRSTRRHRGLAPRHATNRTAAATILLRVQCYHVFAARESLLCQA